MGKQSGVLWFAFPVRPSRVITLLIPFFFLSIAGARGARADSAPETPAHGSANVLSQSRIDAACRGAHAIVIDTDMSLVAAADIPMDCALRFGAGGFLSVSPHGLRIHGPIAADDHRMIFGAPPLNYGFVQSATPVKPAIQGYGDQKISVKWFGAKGDGATNDNDAFALVSAFAATTESITVFVPRGVYIVGKQFAARDTLARIDAALSRDDVRWLQAFMTAHIEDGRFLPSVTDQMRADWVEDRKLPFLSMLAVRSLRLIAAAAGSEVMKEELEAGRRIAEFQRILARQLTPTEVECIGGVFASSWAPVDILAFRKVPSVTIRGEKGAGNNLLSKLKLASGLKFGQFNPNTGQAEKNSGKRLFAPTNVSDMIFVQFADHVEISSLELDGNVDGLDIGEKYGDSGWQSPAYGLRLFSNGNVSVRDVHTHHHALDGIAIAWPKLGDRDPPHPHRIDHLTSDHNARQALTVSNTNSLVVTNSALNHTGAGRIRSNPAAGVDFESEFDGVIRNVTFENVELVGNMGSQISFTGNSGYATFRHVHASGDVALVAGAPGLVFEDSTLEGVILGTLYADGAPSSSFWGRCPPVAYKDHKTLILDTTPTTIEVDGKKVPYCGAYKSYGFSLASKFHDTTFIWKNPAVAPFGGAYPGMQSVQNGVGENLLFDRVTIKYSEAMLPVLTMASGNATIHDSTLEVKNDSTHEFLMSVAGVIFENVTIRRMGAANDKKYTRCGESNPVTTTNLVTEHLRWCGPSGPVGRIPDSSGR
jgi:hypothetical protein